MFKKLLLAVNLIFVGCTGLMGMEKKPIEDKKFNRKIKIAPLEDRNQTEEDFQIERLTWNGNRCFYTGSYKNDYGTIFNRKIFLNQWNLETGKIWPIKTKINKRFNTCESNIGSMAPYKNGVVYTPFTKYRQKIYIYNNKTNRIKVVNPHEDIYDIACDALCTNIIASGHDTILIYNTTSKSWSPLFTMKSSSIFPTHFTRPRTLACSQDGTRAVISYNDHKKNQFVIQTIDVSNTSHGQILHKSSTYDIAILGFSPHGFLATYSQNTIFIWEYTNQWNNIRKIPIRDIFLPELSMKDANLDDYAYTRFEILSFNWGTLSQMLMLIVLQDSNTFANQGQIIVLYDIEKNVSTFPHLHFDDDKKNNLFLKKQFLNLNAHKK